MNKKQRKYLTLTFLMKINIVCSKSKSHPTVRNCYRITGRKLPAEAQVRAKTFMENQQSPVHISLIHSSNAILSKGNEKADTA